jgi:hypothetical protein
MEIVAVIGWILLGVIVASLIWAQVILRGRKVAEKSTIATLLKKHFQPTQLDNITISQRQFPPAAGAGSTSCKA